MTLTETLWLGDVHIIQLMTRQLFKHYRLPCSYVTSLPEGNKHNPEGN